MSSLESTMFRRWRVAIVAVAVLVVMVVAGSARAGAAQQRAVSIAPVGLAGRLTADGGLEANRRGRAPTSTDVAGALVYGRGRYAPLSAIPGASFFSAHVAINDRGEKAGFFADAVPGDDGRLPAGATHGFVEDRRGEITTFDVPGGAQVLVFGNNNRGQVVGVYIDAGAAPGPDGILPARSVHGFVRDRNGRIATFDVPFPYLHGVVDINDRGRMVGFYDDPDMPYGAGGGFLREPDGEVTPIDVPGAGSLTFPFDINNRGQVVGYYADQRVTVNPDGTIPQRAIHGFVWDHGHYRRLDPPRSVLTLPYGINNHGQVVGSYFDAAGRQHGFLLARGRYRTFDAPGRVDTVALDINDGGKVIVPEPGVELNGFRLATD